MRCIALVVFALITVAQVNAASEADRVLVSRIPRDPVKSSGLASIGYSKRLHALEVEFVNGAIYRYLDVPPQMYRELMQASSKARFYDQQVRGHFESVHIARSARP